MKRAVRPAGVQVWRKAAGSQGRGLPVDISHETSDVHEGSGTGRMTRLAGGDFSSGLHCCAVARSVKSIAAGQGEIEDTREKSIRWCIVIPFHMTDVCGESSDEGRMFENKIAMRAVDQVSGYPSELGGVPVASRPRELIRIGHVR